MPRPARGRRSSGSNVPSKRAWRRRATPACRRLEAEAAEGALDVRGEALGGNALAVKLELGPAFDHGVGADDADLPGELHGVVGGERTRRVDVGIAPGERRAGENDRRLGRGGIRLAVQSSTSVTGRPSTICDWMPMLALSGAEVRRGAREASGRNGCRGQPVDDRSEAGDVAGVELEPRAGRRGSVSHVGDLARLDAEAGAADIARSSSSVTFSSPSSKLASTETPFMREVLDEQFVRR